LYNKNFTQKSLKNVQQKFTTKFPQKIPPKIRNKNPQHKTGLYNKNLLPNGTPKASFTTLKIL
jgi:hypothetical protein